MRSRILGSSILMGLSAFAAAESYSWSMGSGLYTYSPPAPGSGSIRADQRRSAKQRVRKRAKKLRHFK